MKSANHILLTVLLLACSCAAPKLAVMSFNVRQSHVKETDPTNNWVNRKEACLEMLTQRKPDLLGLQEAQFKGQWTYLRDTLSAQYASLGVGRKDGKEKDECVGFLYRKDVLELLDGGTFWQSETPETPSVCFDEKYERPVTWGIFRIKGSKKKFLYMNTHMGLTDSSRKKGMALILQRMAQYNPEGFPVILSGDLNTVYTNAVFTPLKESMADSREVAPRTDRVPTYNAWGNKDKEAIIDFIWISKGLRCLEYRTDTASYGDHALISDHYPISATVKF